jgi:predicted transcriptional regulator
VEEAILPRKKSQTLTEAELRLMNVLWEQGATTVSDVVKALAQEQSPTLAYSTVITTLRILEKKNYIEHTKEGRAFVYRAVINRNEARSSALKQLVSRFFNGSPELLVLNIIKQEELDLNDLQQLKKMAEEAV